MNKFAFYICPCGATLRSDFPYNALYCNCGNTIYRLFLVQDIPSMQDVGACNSLEYKEYLQNMNLIQGLKHPYSDQDVSYRPYVFGMGCDGTTDLNIHYVVQKVLFFLGFDDYKSLHDKAYPDEDNSFAAVDFSKCKDEVVKDKLVEDLTIIPYNATLDTLVQELEAINFRSLAHVVEDLLHDKKIDPQLKVRDLLKVKQGVLNSV